MGRIFFSLALLLSLSAPDAAFAQGLVDEEGFGRARAPFSDVVDQVTGASQEKIVGGKEAPPGAFPWTVTLQRSVPGYGMTAFCGGTAYSEDWIVTAAHCMFDRQGKPIASRELAVGWTKGGQADVIRRDVETYIVHKDYNRAAQDQDIALVKLHPSNGYQPWPATPIPLATTEDEAEAIRNGGLLTVAGWGAVKEGDRGTLELRYLEVPLVERRTCNRPLGYNGAVTENMLCAGYTEGGRDSCQGDSGGPLTIGGATPSAIKLLGVVSWGIGCARPNKVGIYTRVSRYVDWVKRCTASPDSCR